MKITNEEAKDLGFDRKQTERAKNGRCVICNKKVNSREGYYCDDCYIEIEINE